MTIDETIKRLEEGHEEYPFFMSCFDEATENALKLLKKLKQLRAENK